MRCIQPNEIPYALLLISWQISGMGRVGDGITPFTHFPEEVRTMVLDQLRERDALKTRVVEVMDRRLRAELNGDSPPSSSTPASRSNSQSTTQRFPPSSAQLSASVEPAVLRALNDVWAELSCTCSIVYVCLCLTAALSIPQVERAGISCRRHVFAYLRRSVVVCGSRDGA